MDVVRYIVYVCEIVQKQILKFLKKEFLLHAQITSFLKNNNNNLYSH